MSESKLYQIYQKIISHLDSPDHSEDILSLFEVFSETDFWVEVTESHESQIGFLLYETKNNDSPILNAFITDEDSDSPPEVAKARKQNEDNVFRKYTGFQIMYVRATEPFDVFVIESEENAYPIIEEMFDAYGFHLSNKYASDDASNSDTLASSTKVIEKGDSLSLPILVLIIAFALILFYIFI